MESRLIDGQSAIDFSTTDIYGQEVSLKCFSNKKLLLSFQRGVTCPFCNLRVHQLNSNPEYRKKGLEIVVVFESTQDTILQSEFLSKIALTIVADPKKELYTLYKIEASYWKTAATFLSAENRAELRSAKEMGFEMKREPGTTIHRLPAEFLINEHQIIHKAYYGNSVADHIPVPMLDEFLAYPASELKSVN